MRNKPISWEDRNDRWIQFVKDWLNSSQAGDSQDIKKRFFIRRLIKLLEEEKEENHVLKKSLGFCKKYFEEEEDIRYSVVDKARHTLQDTE